MDKEQKKALKNQYKSKMAGGMEAGKEIIPVPGDLNCNDMPRKQS